MNKHFLFLLLITLAFNPAHSQSLDWVSELRTSQITEFSVESDLENNSYNTILFSGEIDVDPGPSEVLITTPGNQGNRSICIRKLAENGELIWYKQIFSGGIDAVKYLRFSQDGSLYAVINVSDTVALGQNNVVLYPYGQNILKLDLDGNAIWSRFYSLNQTIIISDLEPDLTGGIVLSGVIVDEVDFDLSTNNATYGVNGVVSNYLFKLDILGGFVWAVTYQSEVYTLDFDIDNNNDLVVMGRFSGTADLDPGTGQELVTIASDSIGLSIQKFSASGTLTWTKVLENKQTNLFPYALITDNSNQITLYGGYSDTVDLDPSSDYYPLEGFENSDLFLCRLNENGDFVWAHPFNEQDLRNNLGQIVSSPDGDIFVTGYFDDPADDAGDPLYSTTKDVFVSKFNVNGQLQWKSLIEGISNHQTTDLSMNGNQSIIMSGLYCESTDFDPENTNYFLTEPNAFFLVKWDVSENASVSEIKDDQFRVFPNPASEKVKIELSNDAFMQGVEVVNALGNVIYKDELLISNSVELNVSEFLPGYYFIRIMQKDSFTTVPFIKR